MLSNRLLFVPDYYTRHKEEWTFPGWEDASLFGKKAPVFIEYCSGNGAWIIEKARQNKEVCWVAVEWSFERVYKIWSKMQTYQLTNLIVVLGEALTFTRFYLPDASVDGVFVNFPDPWPKTRHAKNRLLQTPFTQEMARVTKKGGEAILVTDDTDYSHQMHGAMQESGSWQSKFSSPFYVNDWPDYGTSYFDDLWRKKGKEIYYLAYNK